MSDYRDIDRDCDSDSGSDRGKDCFRCRRPGHPMPKPIIFECGTGNGFSFSSNSDSISMTSECQACTPKSVGVVVVDTTCLCMPQTKIEFACGIHFVFNPDHHGDHHGDCQLEFQLFRSCDNGPDLMLGSWFYEVTKSKSTLASTFSFIWCDCNSCPGCCTYSVRCKPVELEDCSICVNNCHIAAIAKERCSN